RTLLEAHQTAGVVNGSNDLGVRHLTLEVGDRGGAVGGTDLATGQIGEGFESTVGPDQNLLTGLVVDRGERDLLPPFAVHGEGTDHDVDLFVLQHRDPVGGGDDLQLVLVGLAEDRLRDGSDDVDVEALDGAGRRVAGAEQVGVGRDAGDDPTAFL